MKKSCTVITTVNGKVFSGHGKDFEECLHNAWCEALWYFWNFTS